MLSILLKDGHKVASFARSRTPELEALACELAAPRQDTHIDDGLAAKYGSSLLVIQGDL